MSKRFFKRNASTLLTIAGASGVIGTAVMAAKDTPKALKLLEDAKNEKGEELTNIEKIKAAAPAYIPTAITVASTIACVFSANIFSKRSQAALLSAYTLLDSTYKEYRKKTKELYGEESDKNISSEIVKDKYNCQEIDDGKQLFFDYYSMRYFESTMADVLKAEMEVNRLLQERMYVDINTFYDLLDLDPIDLNDEIGWSIEAGVVWQGYSWIAFEHEIVEVDGGMECCIITMNTDPTTDTMDEYH